MAIKASTLRKLLSNYLDNRTTKITEYEAVASAALKKSGYDKVIVFMHGDQFVMINTIASADAVSSGIICNDEQTEIVGFKNSDDRKSVTTDALARCLIMESVDDEADILRLRVLSKHQYNWVIHCISNETSPIPEGSARKPYFPEYLCNVHTHGLNAYTHKDFQIVLNIGRDSCVYLLNTLAEKVRDGEVFSPGETVKGVYAECDIKLAAVKEGGRDVLRILIPDENNCFPGEDGCSYPYSEQARILE